MNKALITRTEDQIAAKLEKYAIDSENAFAPNTVRAIKSDSMKFTKWCEQKGVLSLPATPENIRAYVDQCAEEYKPATVRRYIASIAHLHRAADLPDPTKSNDVKLAIKRMNRSKGTRQKQARGLTSVDVIRILENVLSSERDIRDVAMMLMARDMLARSSEVVAVNVEDLHFDKDGSGTITIR
ncbi:MAG: site-specific integrase, partial [Magnetococcales bacterium]|nr:site-specific integrase [Magnetococcales bacterium]